MRKSKSSKLYGKNTYPRAFDGKSHSCGGSINLSLQKNRRKEYYLILTGM